MRRFQQRSPFCHPRSIKFFDFYQNYDFAIFEKIGIFSGLTMELGTIKDDFVAFREKAATDRETMEAEFDASGDTLFNYGYGCCVFTHNICRSKPQIPDGMPDPSVPLTPEFFANPRCPPIILSTAPALDPTAINKEQCPKNSPTAVGEEATLPMGPPASSDGGVEDVIVN